ncbi:MAG: CapA family protein [Clostridia bacterium]|nr:CapA family protein [Clostridia bacterium]
MADRTRRQQAIIRRRIFLSVSAIVLAVCIAAIVLAVNLISKSVKSNSTAKEKTPSVSSKEEPKEPYVVSTATVVNTGDILVHNPVLWGAEKTKGNYDFSDFFKYASTYFKKSNLAVVNLEVTLGGTQSGKYNGYPAFNTPDSLIDALKNDGIGLLLTSNNHCYDTGLYGLKRTVQVLKEKNMPYIGTRESADEARYLVKDVNGVKIGMACFTYENTCDTAGRKSINGRVIATEANDLVNSFSYNRIDSFYSEAEQMIKDMKKDGADCTVFYMHWGIEYRLKENDWQRTIAQKLCNMGVDVIVGGHPHVVEPMALLHSEGSDHTTACIYSMGNAISNQRKEILTEESPTGHCEDGMLFYYTFDKYSDGTTVLSGVDIIPTWVDKYKGGAGYLYTMIPLEAPTDGSKYGLSTATCLNAQKSYERTMEIVAEGLTECQKALGCKVRFE